MSAPLCRAAGLLLGLSLLVGCGGEARERPRLPTVPGFALPSIRGAYAAPVFWTFEAVRVADAATVTWNCRGRVTIIRQSGPDFLGTFDLSPPDQQLCEAATGNIISGIVGASARISFETNVPGRDPNEFFALPGCVVVTQDALWSGTANGDRLVASRRLTVDCPADGRMQVTARADGLRTTAS